MSKPIIIIGAGGHGKVLYDICRVAGLPLAGFLDNTVRGTIHGVAVLGGDELFDDATFVDAHEFALGVGEPLVRKRLAARVAATGGTLATLIHPSAVISSSVPLGAGTVVNAGAVINIDSRIGKCCIINTRASIDHDCVLGDNVQICPGATLAGGVKCGDDVFVGSGATIVPMVSVGAGSVVGAGCSVIRDVPAGVTVVGVAARIVSPD